jgi:cytochrome c553
METKMTRNASRVAGLITGIALAVSASIAFADDAENVKALTVKLAPVRAQHLAVTWCSACHGPGGRSIAPTFPILAGQSAEYIETELKFFHNLSQDDRSVTHETMFELWIYNITGWRKPNTAYLHSTDYQYDNAPRNEERAWDFMKGVARDLDEPTMQALGAYFSKQTPAAGRTTVTGDATKGKALYLDGDANRGLIACQSCHGPDGKGQGPIPRLAGQHADYVKIQLGFIQSGVRNVEQMQALIANLTPADFDDLAAYVQSLN